MKLSDCCCQWILTRRRIGEGEPDEVTDCLRVQVQAPFELKVLGRHFPRGAGSCKHGWAIADVTKKGTLRRSPAGAHDKIAFLWTNLFKDTIVVRRTVEDRLPDAVAASESRNLIARRMRDLASVLWDGFMIFGRAIEDLARLDDRSHRHLHDRGESVKHREIVVDGRAVL